MNLSNSDKSGRDELSNLIGRAQEGNKQAFAKIYDILAKDVYKFVLFRVGDGETAKDLTSEIFFKVWQKIDSFKPQKDAKFSTWVYQIARFTVIDHYRTTGHEMPSDELPERGSLADEKNWQLEARFDREKDKQKLIGALKSLKDEYREILTLKFINNFENSEIAEILGKTEGNVRVLQLRALKSLAQRLEKEKKNEQQSQKTRKRTRLLRQ